MRNDESYRNSWRGGGMYLETQDGLDFALRIFHSSFISIDWNSRTGDSEQPLPDGLHGNSQGERQHFLQNCDKSQFFSFLGGAVMLLVYEYTYAWLQKNW